MNTISAAEIHSGLSFRLGSYLKNTQYITSEDNSFVGVDFEVHSTIGVKYRLVYNFVVQSFILSLSSNDYRADINQRFPILDCLSGKMVTDMYYAYRTMNGVYFHATNKPQKSISYKIGE